MQEDKKTEKIVEKIKKILLKAESTDSLEEAEALFVKASELMVKFKIEQSQVDTAIDESNLREDEVSCGEVSLEGKWEIDLMSAISRHHGVHFIFYTTKKYKMVLAGDKHDVQMVKYFFETARRTFRRLSREQYLVRKKDTLQKNPLFTLKELEFGGYMPYRSVFIRSFLAGCAIGLNRKIRQMQQDAVVKYDSTKSYDLMVKNQLEKSRGYMTEKYSPKTSSRQTAYGDQKAILEGMKAGLEHNLTIGVQGSTKNEGNKIG
jgi:Protein of unknown function (DUF2786)